MSSGSVEKAFIHEGTVTVTGKDSNGQEITFEAPVGEFRIEVENEFDRVYTDYRISSAGIFKRTSETTFRIKVAGDGQYVVKTNPAPRGVERTARVEVIRDSEAVERTPLTLDLITKAAEKAGVPTDTPFRLVEEKDHKTFSKLTLVEFYWTT